MISRKFLASRAKYLVVLKVFYTQETVRRFHFKSNFFLNYFFCYLRKALLIIPTPLITTVEGEDQLCSQREIDLDLQPLNLSHQQRSLQLQPPQQLQQQQNPR